MAEGPGRRRGGGAGRHPGGWSDANLALCLPTSLLCPRLPLPFPTRSSPCLSGPPLCPSTCVLSFLVSSCVCVSLFFSVLVLLPMPVSLRVCFFPLQVGWRRKPTTDLNPTTSPISSLPPKPRRAPSSPPNFVFSGEGPSLPLAPTLAPPPQSISGPSLCPHPLLASLPPTPPTPVPASLLSFLCLCSSPSAPSNSQPPPWALFYSPSASPTLADAVSGSGQLSNISVGREKRCVLCLLSGLEGGVREGVPCAGGLTQCQEYGLAPAWESQNLRIRVKASSLTSTGDRR